MVRLQECQGKITANPSIGGIGTLIGFTTKAFLTLIFTVLRQICSYQFEKHRFASGTRPEKHRYPVPTPPTTSKQAYIQSPTKFSLNSKALFYKRQGRNLNRILLGLSDIQSITSISILVASFAQWSTISLYHLALTNYTAQFAQTANLVALSYVRGSIPERDMFLRDGLVLGYYSMLTAHNVLWYQRVKAEWDGGQDDRCYVDKTACVKDGTRPVAFLWNALIFVFYLWLILRRQHFTLRFLAKATNNRPSQRYLRFLSTYLPKSRWISIPYDFFFRKTGLVVYAVFWFLWIFHDVWFGLFIPNMHRMNGGSDFEWGFGQVLAVSLLASHALGVYQTWSGMCLEPLEYCH
ncbi:hypothetical protein BJ508DRAFT_11378 [Ascobolus immersus RN42]|uniref:Uncharacterized protein n=1 Tax=Ascobolus immersus RN42 TaxID=1160509 RepID=A0A3N4HQW4_ASCIM|nr:hypothetical protein BJ508DRAFT_11378 [Ascobolus immersus RN42]